MKIRSNFLTGLVGLLLTQSTYANVLACPASTNFVNLGDSTAEVIAKCGKPLKHIVLKPEKTQTIVVWQYTILGTLEHAQAFGRDGFAVVFLNGHVTEFRSGKNKMPYMPCTKGRVTLGATMHDVKVACGTPYFKKTIQRKKDEKFPHQPVITKLIYKPRRYLPATTFIFKDDQLIYQSE